MVDYKSEFDRYEEQLSRIYRQQQQHSSGIYRQSQQRGTDWREIAVCFGIAAAQPLACALGVAIAYAVIAVLR